jgi:hypothetical protein
MGCVALPWTKGRDLAVSDQLLHYWPYVAVLLLGVVSLVASGHAVLYQRDTFLSRRGMVKTSWR